jgi:hypothetical protein
VNVTDNQRTRILDEIMEMTMPRKRRPFEFTRKEYQEHTGLTQAQAVRTLAGAVENTPLKTEKILLDGKWTNVYWRPEDEPQ